MTGRGEEYQEGVNTDGWVNLSRLLRRRVSCNTEGFVSSLTDRCWDCFVAVLLAMTVGGLPTARLVRFDSSDETGGGEGERRGRWERGRTAGRYKPVTRMDYFDSPFVQGLDLLLT